MTQPNLESPALEPVNCPQCLKLPDLCVCSEIKPVENAIQVLILQHPQEPDKDLGTARLAHLTLKNSTLKVGLSWPNLSKALGRTAQGSKWAVLYLGSGIKGKPSIQTGLQFISKQGAPLPTPKGIEGIVVIDGTWSQAKALWWRNAWLLKLNRAVLIPAHPSLYRELRKEPRRECLSTLESIGEALVAIGEPASTNEELRSTFSHLLKRYRSGRKSKR